MAYSTIEQFRANVPKLTVEDYEDPSVVIKIAQADKIVKQDLANIINFDLVPEVIDDPATPDYINLLSQYKTAEMALTAVFGAKRELGESSDVQYWQKEYSNPQPRQGERLGLLDRIINGSIPLKLDDGTSIGTGISTFTRDARPDIQPALGMGKRGEFATNTQLRSRLPETD